VYNHLPSIDPTRSLDGRRHARRDEETELRQMHVEHVAAERARAGTRATPAPLHERMLPGPAGAILALLDVRRGRLAARRPGSTHRRG
jgi:hypothetical protein